MLKLGKKPYRHDERTLQLHDYLLQLPYIPAISHWPNVSPLGMLLNDQLSDCAIAAPLHMEMIWSKENGTGFMATDQQALDGYKKVGGYVPGDPSTDNGCVMLDVLKEWVKNGFGGRPPISAFVQVNPKNHNHVRAASFLFGGLFVGVALPISAQTQTDWDVPPQGPTGNGTPGSWGGHAIAIPGNDYRGLDTITWGTRIKQSWNFWDTYVDEAYAVLSKDFAQYPNVLHNVFDFAKLQADLQVVRG